MAASHLFDFIFNPTDSSSHTDSNLPSWRSLSSVCLVIWVSVLKKPHVSSHWYFSAPHAASVSMLLSSCFWLAACLCEQSKRCRVSLNKLMGSFVFGVPLFILFIFLWLDKNSYEHSLVFAEELYSWPIVWDVTLNRGSLSNYHTRTMSFNLISPAHETVTSCVQVYQRHLSDVTLVSLLGAGVRTRALVWMSVLVHNISSAHV